VLQRVDERVGVAADGVGDDDDGDGDDVRDDSDGDGGRQRH